MIFQKQKFDSKQLKINKFISDVKQLKINKFLKSIWQLIIGNSHATLEVPSPRAWKVFNFLMILGGVEAN